MHNPDKILAILRRYRLTINDPVWSDELSSRVSVGVRRAYFSQRGGISIEAALQVVNEGDGFLFTRGLTSGDFLEFLETLFALNVPARKRKKRREPTADEYYRRIYCTRCALEPRRAPNQSFCRTCHAEVTREWRARSPEARRRNAIRSKTRRYLRRRDIPLVCSACRSMRNVEAHHTAGYRDYLAFVLLCRRCHRWRHAQPVESAKIRGN